MTKLDQVIERIRQLPQERQEAIAEEMEFRLHQETESTLLTDEQWAEVEVSLEDENEPTFTHDEVVAHLRARFPG